MGHGQTGAAKGLGDADDVDDGTLAITDSPQPGPIGLDARSGGSGAPHAAPPAIALSVLSYARRQQGSRVGDGECFTLANRALSSAGARSARDFGTVTPDADYVWGTSVTLSDLQPGDIIQFRDYRYDREVTVENADGSSTTDTDFQERPHHTAIVETVDGNGAVTVLEQNAPQGSAVRRSHLFFSDQSGTSGRRTTTVRVQGTFWFYRPQPR